MQHIHKRAPINVLLADDCALLRQGLRIALTAEPDLEVVAEAANGEEALHLILSLTPDVAILDIDLPERDGFAVAKELNRLNSPVRAIILTLHTGIDLIFEALEIGIRGYVLKSSAASDIAEGVRRVAAGDTYFSPEVGKILQSAAAKHHL